MDTTITIAYLSNTDNTDSTLATYLVVSFTLSVGPVPKYYSDISHFIRSFFHSLLIQRLQFYIHTLFVIIVS